MKPKKTKRALGSPRSFETGKALDEAMKVFWCKGYEGASLSDLTRAMGINRPSLYAPFGDKEALFRNVLYRYDHGPAAYVREALNQPTSRAAWRPPQAIREDVFLSRARWRAATKQKVFETISFCVETRERRRCACDSSARRRKEI
jgi:AcrR family transcriptional regulator